jgi:predicted permease
MSNIAILVVCLLIGMILRKTQRMPDNGHAALNAFIINVALPALILAHLHGQILSAKLLVPVSMPWVLFALAAGIFAALGRILRLAPEVTGALIMTTGLANTSFVGLPMIQAFYGPKDLAIGIIIDQLGTYLVLSTLGIALACYYSSGTASWRQIAVRIATFPPLIALLLALAASPIPYPAWLGAVFAQLGATLAPLALVSVGLQLRLEQFRGNGLPLSLGLGFKLVIGPLLILLLYWGTRSWDPQTLRVTIFEAAMGPQIGGGIVAMQYGLSPALITLMIGLGIALSFVTLPVWYLGLKLI